MDHELLKRRIADQIVFYRKKAGLTQVELAQKLNYSDKAVSKWERAESMPDVTTLVALAEVLGVTADALIYEPQEPEPMPETAAEPEPVPEPAPEPEEKPRKQKKEPRQSLPQRRWIIGALVSILVWFLAMVAWQLLSDFYLPGYWVGFLLAVPVNALVLLCLLSAWRYYKWNHALISTMMWGFLILIFAVIWAFGGRCLPKLLLFGLPGQLAISLWFRMLHKEDKQ